MKRYEGHADLRQAAADCCGSSLHEARTTSSCINTIMNQASDVNFPIAVMDLSGTFLFRNRPLDLLLDSSAKVPKIARIQDFFDSSFCDERLDYCERSLDSHRIIKLADFVRGTRFVTSVHPLHEGPWPRAVLCTAVPRMAKPDEEDQLVRVVNRDEGTIGTLTPREKHVLGLLARGMTHKEIAEAIGRTIKTVETHRAAIGRKLRVHKNIYLVEIARNAGLLDSNASLPHTKYLDDGN